MRRIILSSAVLTLAALTPARAQNWVDSVLPERAFDAGTVARGSKVRHTFRLVNRLDQEVRIVNSKPKCGCTDVHIGAYVIPPGTQTTIEAIIDTTKFQGYKPSGLTLVLDRPTYAEVDLNLSCFIRGDITLNPGVADFGVVTRSPGAKPTVTLNLTYAGGQANWGVTKMQTQSSRVTARLQEQTRSADGQVRYLLTATLDPSDTTGFYKDEITLFTNDSSGPAIPIAVSAAVQSAVTVSPSPLLLGQVRAGQVVTKSLLVRSTQPFRLTSVKPGKDELTPKFDADSSRPVHTVGLTFKVPSQPGPYNASVEVATDLKDEPPVKVTVFANVAP